MPTYIVLEKFTAQGVSTLKNYRDRVAEAKRIAQAAGGTLTAYLTMGRYDVVSVLTAPDDETATKIVLSMAQRGNVSTQTLRGYTEEEAYRLVEGLR